ncbi:ABC transporter substrate-binding protein [Salinirubellus salinus]|uniref:ABC transporter substrate-binding protein n=1 Tax=Salinirubellus salinus TaxID=1364945 RepID=A0A9E7R0D2_9EURY|nr:ABC transporter substrate-binding protein [Salinirubellus salinus]UWM53361.1 ABC transporter substrate-binding protein [Salinirubellus salinus]
MPRHSGSVDRRTFLKTTAVTGLGAALAGCSGAGGSDTVTVGMLQPFTGEVAWVGESSEHAVEIAIDEINAAGGINGKEVELVTEDSEANQQTAVSAERKLINSDGSVAILGPTSFTLPAVMNIAQEEGVPQVSPTAGTSELDEKGGEYVFRTSTSDSLGGKGMAYIADQTGHEEIAVMYVDNQGGRSFGKTVVEGFEALGGTVTAEIAVSPGKSSYRSELNKAFADDPSFVSLTSGTQTGKTIIDQWHEQDLGGVWGLSNDMQTGEFASKMGAKLEGSYAIGPLAGGDRYQTFADKYRDKTDEDPMPFTAEAYDAMNIVALAAAAAGENSPGAIAENLIDVSAPDGSTVSNYEDGLGALEDGNSVDYEGASGPVNFDTKGNVRSPFGQYTSDGGSWTLDAEIAAEDLTF